MLTSLGKLNFFTVAFFYLFYEDDTRHRTKQANVTSRL